MYRAITLHFQRTGVDLKDHQAVQQALTEVRITFQNIEGKNTTFLNDENVESQIRTMEVSHMVSDVAAIPIVRKFAVAQQHEMGTEGALVMDGRDIGTVVFPNAALKLFISASLETRTQRRYLELKNRGENITLKEVEDNLAKRDHIDSTRSDSPLMRAIDAVGLDTTHLNTDEALDIAYRLASNIINSEK